MAQPWTSLLGRLRLRDRGIASSLVLLFLPATLAAAAGVTVQAVEVRLVIEGAEPPAVVRARIQETVETVAQRLLTGRAVDQLRPGLPQLRTALATVVDRVISGYSVTESRVELGATAAVLVRLRPDPPLIQVVEVIPRTDVDPVIAPLLTQPVEQDVVPAVRTMFLGMPVEAVEWAAPLIADDVDRTVEDRLPGFGAVVRVHPAALARVELELRVRGTRVVRDIGVRFRSGSIPLLLLEPYAPAVASMAGPIRGLPIVFVERQRKALEQLVAERLRTYGPVIEYHIIAQPVLSVGETTYVTVVADSLRYLGRAEAALNVGVNAPAAELSLHLGRLVGRLEAFVEVGLVPSTLSTRYDLGLRYRFTTALDVGTSYRLNTAAVQGFVFYRFTPDLSVRVGYEVPVQRVEAGVRYRFNEFLSGEVVGTSGGDYYFRLISNL